MEEVQKGFWGQITATRDWCEHNYEVTPYVAEFWNTISNFWLLFYGIFGAVVAYRHEPERIFSYTYFGLFLVGVGSFLFHCTLKWETQLLDEIPMIFCSMPLLYSMYGATIYSKRAKQILAIFLTIYPLVIVPTYVVFKFYKIFEYAYGATVFALIFGGYSLTSYANSIAPKNVLKFPNNPLQMYIKAMITYTIGYSMWQFDNHMCHILSSTRFSVGYYLAPVFQFHAFWHFGGGYGTYLCGLSTQLSINLIKQHCPRYQKEFQKYNQQQQVIGDYYFFGKFLPYVRKMSIEEMTLQNKQQ